MNFENPINQQINGLKKNLIEQEKHQKDAELEINWYNAFNLSKNSDELKKVQGSIVQNRIELDRTKSDLSILVNELLNSSENLVPIWKFKSYFSPEQKSQRKLNGRIKEGINMLKIRLEQGKTQEVDLKASEEKFKNEIQKYREFDIEHWSQIHEAAKKSHAQIQVDLGKKKIVANELDQVIQDTQKQINKNQSELGNIEVEIKKIEGLDRSLNNAKNAYERAMIHKECERMFGVGQPSRAINKLEKHKGSIERNINKITYRLSQQIERYSRNINHLIFDGNNFCYCGEKFIGLTALNTVVSELQQYKRVSVIFDAGIRGLCRSDNQAIKKKLPNWLEIHIVATKQKADETILGFASGNQHAFIITNDRFSDFKSENAVKQKRLIRHEILTDRVFIHDLNINLTY
jgi:hypothetical protein